MQNRELSRSSEKDENKPTLVLELARELRKELQRR